MSAKIETIIVFCMSHDIEIVSYGMAPNPWGFCFEAPEGAHEDTKRALDLMLGDLSKSEELELRRVVF